LATPRAPLPLAVAAVSAVAAVAAVVARAWAGVEKLKSLIDDHDCLLIAF